MKYLILLFMLLSASIYSQQLDSLDRIDLNNGKSLSGKVVKITSGTVQFREAVTSLLYEYQKSEIRDLKLSNGTVLTFTTPAEQGAVTGSMQNNPAGSTNQTANPPSQTTTTQGNTNVTGNNNTGGTTATDNTGSQRTGAATTTSGQQQPANQQQQNENNPGGLSTTALILLGASGVIVLLLLGAAIF